jgi:hypothetical protein
MDVPLQPRLQNRIAVSNRTILTRVRRLSQPSRNASSQDAANLCLRPIVWCRPRHVTREA